MQLCVWILVGLILYTYAGYPALIWFIGRLKKRYTILPSHPPQGLSVCVVVATYNEERIIGEQLNSILRQRYPRELTDIVVVDDGSDDGTRAIVTAYEQQDVQLVELSRGGKANALNRAMCECKADVVAFTDADTLWLPETLHHLLAPFSDPNIGGVAGHVAVAESGRQGLGDRAYRAYETFIRRAETHAGSCVSADGGLFAMRRHLVELVPPSVSDDFYLSTSVVASGKALVYQPRAIVLERSIPRPSNQYRRRVRITVGGMESLFCRRALMNPFRFGGFAIALISHKLLRRLAPAFLLLLFPASLLALRHGGLYQALFAVQMLVYVMALIGFWDRARHLPKLFRIASYIVLGSGATLVGVINFLTGVRYTQWAPQKYDCDSIELRRRNG